MRRIFVLVIGAAVAVTLAWFLAGLPGTVQIELAGYSISFVTPLAVLALALVVFLLVALLKVLGWLWRTPTRMRFWRRRRQRAGGDDAVTRTLVAIAAGDGGHAHKEAARARKLLGDTPQTLLLAAEAGRLANRDEEASAIYKQLAGRDDAALLGLRGLFRQAMTREAWDEAAAIAARAERVHPGGAWLRDERAQLAVRTGNWPQALRLADSRAPRDAFATAAANAESNAEEALRMARRAWKDSPRFVPAALAFARRLRQTGREARAVHAIRDAWTANPHPELAAFVLDPISDPHTRAREASVIVSGNYDHPESRLLMARMALDTGELRDARHHLELARQAGMNQKRLFLLLAEIEQQEHGDTEEGRAALRDALRLAAMADPDPSWRCEACGTEHTQWHAACPACHTPGRVTWGVRPMALLAG